MADFLLQACGSSVTENINILQKCPSILPGITDPQWSTDPHASHDQVGGLQTFCFYSFYSLIFWTSINTAKITVQIFDLKMNRSIKCSDKGCFRRRPHPWIKVRCRQMSRMFPCSVGSFKSDVCGITTLLIYKIPLALLHEVFF